MEADTVEPAAACAESFLPSIFDMDDKWIIDSGSGRNLVDMELSEHHEGPQTSAPTVTLQTGAGLIKCKRGLRASITLGEFIRKVTIHTLESTPSVLALGPCVKSDGFAFVWLPRHRSGLITPDGMIIPLIEEYNITHITAACLAKAIQDQAWATMQVGVYVEDGQLRMSDGVFLGRRGTVEKACAARDVDTSGEFSEPSYPQGQEGGASSSTTIPGDAADRSNTTPSNDTKAKTTKPKTTTTRTKSHVPTQIEVDDERDTTPIPPPRPQDNMGYDTCVLSTAPRCLTKP